MIVLIVWLGIGICAVLLELFTPTALISIWFAAGAVCAILLDFLQIPIAYQIAVFFAVSLITMLVVRPIATRYLRGNTIATNADRMIGEIGTITRTIEEDHWGEVYVHSSYWSAVEKDGNWIEKGKKVKVLAIEGAKLIVKEIEKGK